jgi:AcrR family transcriptional regulator
VRGSNTGRRTTERLTADERRQAAMEATLHLLATVRYEDLLMEDIAVAAGMSRPLLYHYFGGKEQLTAAAVRWYGRLMVEEIYRASIAAGRAWLPASIGAYLDYVTTRSDWYRVLTRPAYLPFAEMEDVRNEIRLRVIKALQRHLAPGGSSPMLRLLLWGWVGQAESICQEWLTHGELDRDVLEPMLCELLPAALRSNAGRDTATNTAYRLLTGD